LKIRRTHSDKAILAELGERLRRHRLQLDQTQAVLARESGVAKRTLERLESGQPTQTESLLRVLRVLGLIENLESLVPAPLPSPLPQARRQRASGTVSESAPWTWGDE
jgi:transcriptional regulator with XRE-family HTH domain